MTKDRSSRRIAAIAGAVAAAVITPAAFLWLTTSVDQVDQRSTAATPSSNPHEYAPWLIKAGNVCPEIDSALITAQIDTDSGWDPSARSVSGAEGLAQFLPEAWAEHGVDANSNGVSSPLDAADAIMALAQLDCRTAEQANADLSAGHIKGELTDIVLASYNCGYGCVLAAGGIDPANASGGLNRESAEYVASVKARISGN